jgi:hypothetical protein
MEGLCNIFKIFTSLRLSFVRFFTVPRRPKLHPCMYKEVKENPTSNKTNSNNLNGHKKVYDVEDNFHMQHDYLVQFHKQCIAKSCR